MNFPARTVTMSLRRRMGNRLLKPTHIILPLLVAFVLPYVAARRASLSPVRLANLLARARSSGLTCKAFTNSAWPRRKVGKSIRTLPKLRRTERAPAYSSGFIDDTAILVGRVGDSADDT